MQLIKLSYTLRLLAFAVSVLSGNISNLRILSGYYPQKDHYCNANGVMAFFGYPHEHIAAIGFAITLIIWSDGGITRVHTGTYSHILYRLYLDLQYVMLFGLYSAHRYIPFIAALFPGSVVTIVIFASKNTSLPKYY